jgi:hypothetical protein
LAPTHLQEGADNRSHHPTEKAIADNSKLQYAAAVPLPTRLIDASYRLRVTATGERESSEIMFSHQVLRSPSHGGEIDHPR